MVHFGCFMRFLHYLVLPALLAGLFQGVMEKSVTERFKLPRVEQKFVPTFTPDEVEKLLDACEEDKSLKPQLRKALTARNRAILSVLIDTGIRLSELVGSRLCDVYGNNTVGNGPQPS